MILKNNELRDNNINKLKIKGEINYEYKSKNN